MQLSCLGAFQRVIDGEESDNCFILSDMNSHDFAEKKNVKVGTATAKVDPEDASAKVLVVIYEVPVRGSNVDASEAVRGIRIADE